MTQPSKKIQLIRKLWVHLAPIEMFGLTPPDKIQRSGQILGEVRRRELSHLLGIEKQLHELRRGHAVMDPSGKIIPSGEIRDIKEVAFSSIIETARPAEVAQETAPDIRKYLSNADEFNRFDILERLIRLQKLCLLAERMILACDIDEIDKSALDRRWFNRWKLNACEISNGALQHLWAKILVKELKRNGDTSLKLLEFISFLSLKDAENLNKLAAWVCGDFIYRSALQALPERYDSAIFEKFEDQSIVRGVTGKVLTKVLKSQSDSSFVTSIRIGNKELSIRSSQKRSELNIPAYMLTSLGMELVELVGVEMDSLYLEQVVQDLQARGFHVNVSQPQVASGQISASNTF